MNAYKLHCDPWGKNLSEHRLATSVNCGSAFRNNLEVSFDDIAPQPHGSVADVAKKLTGCNNRRGLHDGADQAAKRHRIVSMLTTRNLRMVYQPAVRVDRGGVEFLEALARFESDPYISPDRWFKAAADCQLGVELEMLAVRMALNGLEKVPAPIPISVNVSPTTLLSSDLGSLLSSAPLDRIIVEVTEHHPVECYNTLRTQIQSLRAQGLRLAIDDVGAGHSSFRHILDLQPDVIKLDMSLTRGLEGDRGRRALASALIIFAREIGSELVAEGVESFRQLNCLRELGVTIVQGHIVARPGPCPVLHAPQGSTGCEPLAQER